MLRDTPHLYLLRISRKLTSFIAVGLIRGSGKRQNNAVIGSHFCIACLCIFPLTAKMAFKRLSSANRDSSRAASELELSSTGPREVSANTLCRSRVEFKKDLPSKNFHHSNEED